MYFTESDHLRDIERDMRTIPNFRPRGFGLVIMKNDKEKPPPFSYLEYLKVTMSCIRSPPFIIRLNQYIKESEINPMKYRNETHKTLYEETIRKKDKMNYALMSDLYLLTADFKLWQIMKHNIKLNNIDFLSVKLKGLQNDGYTLYCSAKDLYLRTKHITISDLADTKLIPPKTFGLICNAMAIRRFGLKAIGTNEDESMVRGGM